MRLKKLSNQFLLNYLLIFAIITVLGLTTFYMFVVYDSWEQDYYFIDLTKFEEDYETRGFDFAIKNQSFQPEDSLMILSPDRRVIASYNGPKYIGESYTEMELQELVYGENFFNYVVQYSSDGHYMLVVYTVYIGSNFTYILGLILFFIVIFGLVALSFAKYTSNQILLPIKTLVRGVEQIQKGNYDHHIAFDASNELNTLMDAINHMSHTIKVETEKRSLLEANRKQLVRDMSHDIRTPLTNILGYSEKLINKDTFTDEEQKQSIEIIHQYGKSANHLVNELFDLSKMELQVKKFDLKDQDVTEWLRLKIIDFVNEFDRHNIHYDFDIPEETIPIPINDLNLQRLFDNLLLNAIKYNQEGLSIYIGFKNLDSTYQLVIADNGIGIPDDYREKVFEPMVRVEDSRNRQLGGTGLGLSIAKQIVEKHGWSIALLPKAESYFGKGCTFVITILK